jgi:hypothetical protein
MNYPDLIVVGPRDRAPSGYTVINTTSRDSANIGTQLSPFFLGPVALYEGLMAKNMENAWQFSKVYAHHVDASGHILPEYFIWAKTGWKDNFAHRYPMGKGARPLFSYWKTQLNNQWIEQRLGYIDARKAIYFPLYARCVVLSDSYLFLQEKLAQGEKIALWDFDGYNHFDKNMSYYDVIHNEKLKCGHAFVLFGLLTGKLSLEKSELLFHY